MKLIKINAPVELNSGIELASGSVLVMSEAYTNLGMESEGFMPYQVATRLYASVDAYTAKKSAIMDVKSFNTMFAGNNLLVTNFQTVPTEQLLVELIKTTLESIFTSEAVEIIDYIAPVEPEVTEPTEPTEPTTEETTEPTEPEVTEPEVTVEP